jgi:flagellar biosynthesis protein FlhG
MKLITIASGKGGVGKSSLSVNLALALTKLGQRVLVVDADFGLANVDIMLGVNARYNLSHVLRNERQMSEIIQEGHGGIRFISGGSGVIELLRMNDDQLLSVMQGILTLRDPADVILFDLGAGINEHIVRLILSSGETIIVTTPEPTAIMDAYALIKTVSRESLKHPLRLILNKVEDTRESTTMIKGFCELVKNHIGSEITGLGHVNYDEDMSGAIKRQMPLLLSKPNSVASGQIMDIARSLIDIPTPQPTSKMGRLFAKLFGA